MNETQKNIPLCIGCECQLLPLESEVCATCIYLTTESLAGYLVRPLIKEALTAGEKDSLPTEFIPDLQEFLLVWLQEFVDESMLKRLAILRDAMFEAFNKSQNIATTLSEGQISERFKRIKAEQSVLEEQQKQSEKRRAGADPTALFVWDVLRLIAERRFWRRHLRRGFGFDARRQRSLRHAEPIKTNHEKHLFLRAICLSNWAEHKFSLVLSAIHKSKRKLESNRDAITAALDAMTQAESLSLLMHYMMSVDETMPDFLREPATVDLAAWADKRVKEYPSREKGTIENFIAAVRAGVANYLEAEPSKALTTEKGINPLIESIGKEIKRDTSLVEELAQLKKKGIVSELDDPELGEHFSDKTDFQTREELRIYMNTVAAQAGLSPREMELLQYLDQFPDASDADIAEHMHTALNTAKVIKFNIRKKMRRTAHQK